MSDRDNRPSHAGPSSLLLCLAAALHDGGWRYGTIVQSCCALLVRSYTPALEGVLNSCRCLLRCLYVGSPLVALDSERLFPRFLHLPEHAVSELLNLLAIVFDVLGHVAF